MLLNIGAVYLDRGRYRHQESPRRWNNFLLGVHAEISVCVGTKSRRNSRWQATITNMQFGPFCSLLLVLITTFEQQLAVLYTERNCQPLLQ